MPTPETEAKKPDTEQPKAEAKEAEGPWKLKGAPHYSQPYLNPNDGGFWYTEYTDGETVHSARGDTSERSRANAQNAVNRRNKK